MNYRTAHVYRIRKGVLKLIAQQIGESNTSALISSIRVHNWDRNEENLGISDLTITASETHLPYNGPKESKQITEKELELVRPIFRRRQGFNYTAREHNLLLLIYLLREAHKKADQSSDTGITILNWRYFRGEVHIQIRSIENYPTEKIAIPQLLEAIISTQRELRKVNGKDQQLLKEFRIHSENFPWAKKILEARYTVDTTYYQNQRETFEGNIAHWKTILKSMNFDYTDKAEETYEAED